VSEAQFALDVSYLRKQKNFPDVERAITAYLKYHSKHAAATPAPSAPSH